MAKRKEYRQYCDNYALRFNDDEPGVVWTTGNLQRFLRNLWNANPILRELNPERTATEYALRVGRNMCNAARNAERTEGRSGGNFYLVPETAKLIYRQRYSGKVSRNVMKAAKVL